MLQVFANGYLARSSIAIVANHEHSCCQTHIGHGDTKRFSHRRARSVEEQYDRTKSLWRHQTAMTLLILSCRSQKRSDVSPTVNVGNKGWANGRPGRRHKQFRNGLTKRQKL